MAGLAHRHARSSALHSARAGEASLRLALDQLDEGVLLLDGDGAVALANRAVEALLGRPLSQVPAAEADRVIAPALAALRTGDKLGPERLQLADPRRGERTLEYTALAVRENGVSTGAIEVLRDLTRSLRRDDALDRADRELGALHERLLRLGQDRSMTDLASGTALALNNELNSVRLALELARRQIDPQATRHLATIEAAVERAAALVARLQKVGARRTHAPPRPLDLNAAVMEALDLVRPELTSADDHRAVRVDAHLGTVAEVLAPGGELREALCKLLVAARDDLPPGGVLRLTTRSDGGRGELELEYPTADDGSANDEGLHLALDAVRELVGRWQGELHEEHEDDQRRLRLSLPLAPEDSPHAEPPVRQPTSRAALRVLVVDDDAGNRETLTELLALSGHQADSAASSEAALARLERHPYDAALVDLAMPGMNGIELARRLRAEHPEVRIALVTGWEPGATGASDEPGLIDAIFRKPIDLPAIEAFLREGQPAHA